MNEQQTQQVKRWGRLDLSLSGPDSGNPYRDITLRARFSQGSNEVEVDGFYYGNGQYLIRFMPELEGEWNYITASNHDQLDGISGAFHCIPPEQGNRGPVRVVENCRFAYADGTPFLPYGTTCYAWIYQDERMQEKTLQSLAKAPFNKLRMCVFPKNYSFNNDEPETFPFAGNLEDGIDFESFNPNFFASLESHLDRLQELGVEAELILFHPYDKGRWGFDRMSAETDQAYLRYVIARLGAYRHVWWSLANEYDFMKEKSMAEWDDLVQTVWEVDPYGHPRSIHNGTKMYDHRSIIMYDHTKPGITHCSIQHWDVTMATIWLEEYGKPVVIDECCYEGNLPQRWGNITGLEMVRRFWEGMLRGAYVTHGETYVHPQDKIWWTKGGQLYGESPERIAFLRQIMEQAPEKCQPIKTIRDVPTIGIEGEYYLQYYGLHRPSYRIVELPEDAIFRAEIIDAWNMTVTKLPGELSGTSRIDLPDQTDLAIRITRI